MKRAAVLLLGVFFCAAPASLGATEPRAGSLFGAGYTKLFQRPFFASAVLTISRPGVNRRLLLALYYRDRARSFIRVTGSQREMGTVALRKDGRVYLFFPRADLLLNLPPSIGSFPLFGSDFATDDVLAFADFGGRFTVSKDREETVSGVPASRYLLAPQAPAASPYAEIRLWVARTGGLPLRQEFVSQQGKVMREVVMESDGRLPFPARWKARTFGPRGGESELRFTFFERDPPVNDDLFTVEGLRQWR